MVQITELQSILLSENFWDDRTHTSIFGMAGSGISTVLRDLTNQSKDKKYIYVDLYDIGEKTEINALKLIFLTLSKELSQSGIFRDKKEYIDNNDYFYLRENLMDFTKGVSSDKKIILILDNFENIANFAPYFFETLRDLAGIEYKKGEKIKFIISSDSFINDEPTETTFGKFYPTVFTNLIFVRGFLVNEIEEPLKTYTTKSVKVASKIAELSAGNPKIVDRLLELYAKKSAKNKAYEFEDYEILISEDKELYFYLVEIFKSLTDQLKVDIVKVVNGITPEKMEHDFGFNYLIETGIIKLNNQKYELNLMLLRLVLQGGKPDSLPLIKTQGKKIVTVEDLATDKLSSQEYEVFLTFRKAKGKLITKDEIAKIMWGRKDRGKKEDWAIDQLMKRLRIKIGDKEGKKIQTVRGRGYRYIV